jgi:hypothetical protein
MAITTTASDLQKFAEVAYTPKTIQSGALKDTPLTAYLPKQSSGGLNVTTRLLLRESGGQAPTLAAAITAENDPGAEQVVLSWKKFYTSYSLDNDAIEQSDKNAAVEALRLMMDSTLRRHGDKLETALWGDGSGAIGRIATGGISGNVATLTNPNDVFNFEVGMTLVFDDTATGASLRAGSTTVASIQYAAGTVTVANFGSITGEAAGDYIFESGFENAGGPIGIRAWLTDVASSGDAFGSTSFDRYPYGERAAGWKYSASAGETNREAIIRGLSYGKQFHGRPDVVFGSVNRVASLIVELQNRVEYDGMTDGNLKLNFRGVKLAGPQGDVLVMAAQKCPNDTWFALERASWKIHHVGGDLVRSPFQSGKKIVDSESEDGIRGRWKSSYVLTNHMPGHNGRIVMQ